MSGTIDIQNGAAILTALGRFHLSTQVMGEPLHSVADAQHRDAQRQNGGVAFRSFGVVDRTRSARKHNARGFEPANFIERSGARQHGRKNLLFADAPRNQLRVLAAEIEYNYAAAL